MAWTVLIASGVLEAVWATALGKSEGLTKLWPSVIFIVVMSVSLVGLGWAMKYLPAGTAYAVWVGIGATLAVVYAMATGEEPVSVARVLLICGLVGCIVGLRLVN